jgi:DNA invertase Pin-like site-specific DNA recombinase
VPENLPEKQQVCSLQIQHLRISGAKGREDRPGFDAALKGASAGAYDVLMAWDVSRLGRSLADLATALRDLHAAGRGLYLHVQGMDTTCKISWLQDHLISPVEDHPISSVRDHPVS